MKVRNLQVNISDASCAGQLLKTSVCGFRYRLPDPEQATASLLMSPRQKLNWQDEDVFAPMDQNLPEGDLFMRIRERFPQQPMTPMHLLAWAGRHGIGRLGYRFAGAPDAATPRVMSKSELLRTPYTPIPCLNADTLAQAPGGLQAVLPYNVCMRFEWDPVKAAANAKKHKVTFDVAKTVFYDEFAVQFFDDGHADDEDRFLLLGMSSDARLLLVCHCEREGGDVIRIISARKATQNEARHYRGE